MKEHTQKREFLELYLNQIYLGQGTYGIAAASLEYFDKSVKELNYSEAALLTALPKAQVNIIHINIKVAKFRRNLVLENLEENKFLSKKQLIEFKKFKTKFKTKKDRNSK